MNLLSHKLLEPYPTARLTGVSTFRCTTSDLIRLIQNVNYDYSGNFTITEYHWFDVIFSQSGISFKNQQEFLDTISSFEGKNVVLIRAQPLFSLRYYAIGLGWLAMKNDNAIMRILERPPRHIDDTTAHYWREMDLTEEERGFLGPYLGFTTKGTHTD